MEGLATFGIVAAGITLAVALSYMSMQAVLLFMPQKERKDS